MILKRSFFYVVYCFYTASFNLEHHAEDAVFYLYRRNTISSTKIEIYKPIHDFIHRLL